MLSSCWNGYPLSIQKVAIAVRGDGSGTVTKMQQVAKDLEQVTKGAPTDSPPKSPRVTTVQIEQPGLKLQDYLSGASFVSALVGIGEGLMVLFLVIFLLTSRRSLQAETGKDHRRYVVREESDRANSR